MANLTRIYGMLRERGMNRKPFHSSILTSFHAMCMGLLKIPFVVAAFVLLIDLCAPASFSFVYVSDHRVITIEPVSENRLILNVINLSDEVLVVHPYDVLLQAGSKTSLGQVFQKDEKGAADVFYATRLIKPREFVGLTVMGDLMPEPSAVVFRSASRFFFLQKLEKIELDILARQITTIDLQRENSELALKHAGIIQGYGKLEYYPDGETENLDGQFPEIGEVLPPLIVQKSDPKVIGAVLPGSEVEVKGLVSKRGELLDAHISKGLSPEADRRALAVIENSWKFLPAVRDGEVLESTVTLRVRFVE
ncbi:MAG: energy transducer TonB [Acidobacteria bacterium]|nr:energy transducer TonB [Acidobacteriota bacterium]